MSEIVIKLPGKPIAKKTHRDSCHINWKTKSVKRWRRFPQSEEAKLISAAMKSQYDGPILDHSVFVLFEFYMGIPTRWRKDMKEKARKGLLHHIMKPDASNLAKFYEDCMRGVVFTDDSVVVWISPVKLFSDEPRTEIFVKPFNYEEYCLFKQAIRGGVEDDPLEAAM